MDFVLGRDSSKQARKSARSLISYTQAEKGSDHNEAIYLILNTKVPLARSKDYIPRIIPLVHKLDSISSKSVLLITKDPSTPYRNELLKKGSPTEDLFNEIYTLAKTRSLVKNPKRAIKIYKEFDIIVADHRVHKLLPDILGATFYVKNKKVPFMVQMARPDSNAQLTRGKKSAKLKDDRCDSKYVNQQMKSIVRNTYYIPTASGNCVSVKVGYSNWKPEDLVANINSVVNYLVDQKNQPVGGTLRTIKNIVSAHIKTSESVSLPIYKSESPQDGH